MQRYSFYSIKHIFGEVLKVLRLLLTHPFSGSNCSQGDSWHKERNKERGVVKFPKTFQVRLNQLLKI